MNTQDRIDQAVKIIEDLGFYDGAHHKQYVLNQVLKVLLAEDYEEWLEHNPDWDIGIDP